VNLEAALMNHSLQQGQEVLNNTVREEESIAEDLEMNEVKVKKFQ